MQKVTGHSILLWLLASGSSAHASQQQGVDWLKQAINNSSVNNPSIASDVQVRNELAYTLSLLDSYPSNIDVSVGDDQSTEALSRALLLAEKSGVDSQALLQSILVRQNSDGGFGHLDGWQSTILDTAVVLLVSDNLPKESVLKAIQFLNQQQATDGGYHVQGYQPIESLYINAYVLLAANKVLSNYTEITENLKKLITFLEAQQTSGGQWSNNQADLFIDALLNEALHAYRQNTDIATLFNNKALSLQQANGSWDDDSYVTSLVLRSLYEQNKPITNPLFANLSFKIIDAETKLPLNQVQVSLQNDALQKLNFTSDNSGAITVKAIEKGHYSIVMTLSGYDPISFDVNLAQGQQLTLQTLQMSRAANTLNTQITGVVVDVNNNPISGVIVKIKDSTQQVVTDSQGKYLLNMNENKAFIVEFSKEGYLAQSQAGNARGGVQVVNSQLASEIGATSLTGRVVDTLGNPIPLAIVSFGNTTIQTDQNGQYQFSNVSISVWGSLTVVKAGYRQESLSVKVENVSQQNIGTLTLTTTTEPILATATLSIVARDARYGTAIVGAEIKLERLDSNANVIQTRYLQTVSVALDVVLPLGSWRVSITHPSYVASSAVNYIENITSQGTKTTLTHYMYLKRHGLQATLVDSQTEQVLANVDYQVLGTDGTVLKTGQSDAQGQLNITGLEQKNLIVNIRPMLHLGTKRSYDRQYFSEDVMDIGQIRLRPLSTEINLPDLQISQIDKTLITTEQQNLAVNGVLKVSLQNYGRQAVSYQTPFKIIAFYDRNKNAKFDAEDVLVGEKETLTDFAIKEQKQIDINISGQSLFKDEPIAVYIDVHNSVIEQNENNNIKTSAESLLLKQPQGLIDPQIAHRWSYKAKGDTTYFAIAPLNDDNGDGKIGMGDHGVVLVTDRDFKGGVCCVTVKGIDFAKNKEVVFETTAMTRPSSPAVADLDADGQPEVVVSSPNLQGKVATRFYNKSSEIVQEAIYPSTYYNAIEGLTSFHDVFHNNQPISTFYQVLGLTSDRQFDLRYSQKTSSSINSFFVPWNGFQADDAVLTAYKMNVRCYPGTCGVVDMLGLGIPTVVSSWSNRLRLVSLNNGDLVYKNYANDVVEGDGGVSFVVDDIDEDGKPDIVYGTKDNQLIAIRNDGSELWRLGANNFTGVYAPGAYDKATSGGVTVFDLDGDGHKEVITANDSVLTIVNGQTGAIISRTLTNARDNYGIANFSRLKVADVDADGHADIVMSTGWEVLVFSSQSKSWMNTRNLWNQEQYNITNVNDDLTIPQYDRPWLTHNSYGVQINYGTQGIPVADATASYVRIQDNGTHSPSVFTARIGNAGGKPINTGLPVSFYQGNPAQGGVLIGTTLTSRALASGEYEDIILNYTGSLATFGELFIVANDKGAGTASIIQEYMPTNNTAHIPIDSGYQKFNLQSGLDKNSYQSTEVIKINSIVNNLGSFDTVADLHLSLVDSVGQTLGSLPSMPLSLAVQATVNNASVWSVSGLRKGDYTLKAELYGDNQRVAKQMLPFSILSDASANGLLIPSLYSNKKSYSSADVVTVTQQVRNSSSNEVANNVHTMLVLQTVDGTVMWQQSRDYSQISPQILQEQSYQIPLLNAAAGDYVARLTIVADNVPQVAAEASFNVLPTSMTGVGLSGQLQGVVQAVWYQDIAYTWQLNNQGNSALTHLPVRVSVINPQTEQLLASTSHATVDIAQSNQTQQESHLSLSGVTGISLLALLQVQIDQDWKTLSQQPLTLLKPVVNTSVSMDKAQYGLNEAVTITEQIDNQSIVNLNQVNISTLISRPDGQIVYNTSTTTNINAQSQFTQPVIYTLNRGQAGQWQVTTIIQDQNGIELSRQLKAFEVTSTALTGEGLTGTLTLPAEAFKGQNITIDWHLLNAGNAVLTQLPTRIELVNAQNQLIATLDTPVEQLALDTPLAQQSLWTVTGVYNQAITARLVVNIANQWKVLANAPLQVLAPQVSEILTTRKTSYGINELLDINQQIKNDSPVLLNNVKVTTLISRPDGLVVDTQQTTLNLAAQSGVEQPVSYQFNQADAGQWTITSIVQDEQSIELTRQVKTIEVQSTAITGEGISGTLTATPVEVIVGQDVTFALALNNQGNAALNQQVISLTINKVGSTTPVKVITITVDSLAKASTVTTNANWTVTGQAGDVFSVVATTRFNGQVNTLASASFMAKAPEIAVELTPELAAQSRVLVYYSCGHDWYKGIKGWSFGDCHYSCFDQRSATLRAYLDSLKVNYSLVTKESDFVKAFRSGRYNQTWLLGAIEKLPKDMDEELHEAVHRGDALVTDGGVQTWYNHEIYDIVGVKYRGRLNFSNSEMTLTAPVFSQTQAIGNVKSAGWPLYLKATTGTVTATYGANYCKSVDKDWIRDKEGEDKAFYGRHQLSYPAMISNQYGYGKGLSMAFDLIASLDQPTEKTKWLSLLDQSLSWTNPTVNHRVDYVPQELVAVRSQLKNAGTQAQTIRLQVTLPVGAVWMGTGSVDANRTVTQTITLAANSQQQVWLPILLPSLTGTHQLTIKALSADGQQILSEKQQPFTVKGIDSRFAEVRIAFEQLALNKQDDKLRDKVVDEIRDAQYLWSKGRYQEALAELGDASAYIRSIEGRDVSKERLALDILMKGLSIQWFNAQR